MAKGTITFPKSNTSGSYIIGKIEWSSEKNDAGNYSLVDGDLYIKKDSTDTTLTIATSGTWSYTLAIGDKDISGSVSKSVLTSWVKVASLTDVKIIHESNGSKKVTIKGSVSAPSGTSLAGKKTSGSKSESLDNIPRISEPTLSATSATMKGKLTIYTNRKSSSFTHTLAVKFGDYSATIKTGVGASYEWTVPDLASYCDDALQGTATITCTTYNGSTKIGSDTVNVTLKVPSATTPKLSASTFALGTSVTVTTSGASSNFTHNLSYAFPSSEDAVSFGTGIKSSDTLTVPLTLASKIKKDTEGKGKIICVTKNGTATVGTKEIEFTATVPNNNTTKPKASMVLTPQGLSSDFSGLYVQGRTAIKADFTASSAYADISSYSLEVEGNTTKGDPTTSEVLNKAGESDIVGTVTDSRGYSRVLEESINVIAYSNPIVIPYSGGSMIVCARCKQDGTLSNDGTYLKIKCGRKYSEVKSDGTQHNFCRLYYRWKKASSSGFSSAIDLISADDVSTNMVDITIPNVVTSIKDSYNIEIVAVDTIGEKYTFTATIPTDEVTLHLNETDGKGVGVGKYNEKSGYFECEYKAEFKQQDNSYLLLDDTGWISLGLSSVVSAEISTEDTNLAHNGVGCFYRVINQRHVYIAFCCALSMVNNTKVTISENLIPTKYRPKNYIYQLCIANNRNVARCKVRPQGDVAVDWVQVLSSDAVTDTTDVGWIDGYIDYWI